MNIFRDDVLKLLLEQFELYPTPRSGYAVMVRVRVRVIWLELGLGLRLGLGLGVRVRH